jgi:hypothetical protein
MDEEAQKAAPTEILKFLRQESSNDVLIEKPRELYSIESGEELQRWDAIYNHEGYDTLFLLDCRRCMRKNILSDIKNRVDSFSESLKIATSVEGNKNRENEEHFKTVYSTVIGIACGGSFSIDLRQHAVLVC